MEARPLSVEHISKHCGQRSKMRSRQRSLVARNDYSDSFIAVHDRGSSWKLRVRNDSR